MINPEAIQPYKGVPHYYGEVVFILNDFKVDTEKERVYFYTKSGREYDRPFDSVNDFLAKLKIIEKTSYWVLNYFFSS